MDLQSGRLILTLEISPSNQLCKTPQQMHYENNAAIGENCIVGARICVGLMPRSENKLSSFQNYPPKERKNPPLKNKKWKR